MSEEFTEQIKQLREQIIALEKRVEIIESKFQHEFRWAISLDAYKEQVSLKFTKQDFSKALEIIYGEEQGMPYMLVGYDTIIVPKEAIKCFEGLSFKSKKVLDIGDLPPEEAATLRAENLGD